VPGKIVLGKVVLGKKMPGKVVPGKVVPGKKLVALEIGALIVQIENFASKTPYLVQSLAGVSWNLGDLAGALA
jgi:hypothetical protein